MPEFSRLHLLLVHLPIGILLLALLFDVLSRRPRGAALSPAVLPMLYLGSLAAVLSCITGWFLAKDGAYQDATLNLHRWLGIGTATLALVAAFLPRYRLLFNGLTTVSLVATGHFGGTLTHGEGFLIARSETNAAPPDRPAELRDWQVFDDLVLPILQEKCSACHGPNKQKSQLRLDNPDAILKGGESGKLMLQGELLRRCTLPLHEEEHMPPAQKKQLSPAELDILKWWIENGADFQKRVHELPTSEKVKDALVIVQNQGQIASASVKSIPPQNPPAASPELIEKLEQEGVSLHPVVQGRNWLAAAFFNQPTPSDSTFLWLEYLAPQLLWLNLSGCKVPDTAWPMLGRLKNLTQLNLSRSSVSAPALARLNGLTNLQKINLSETEISEAGLLHLRELKNLRQIFLFKTKISGADISTLETTFLEVKIDTGGYLLQIFESDTARLR